MKHYACDELVTFPGCPPPLAPKDGETSRIKKIQPSLSNEPWSRRAADGIMGHGVITNDTNVRQSAGSWARLWIKQRSGPCWTGWIQTPSKSLDKPQSSSTQKSQESQLVPDERVHGWIPSQMLQPPLSCHHVCYNPSFATWLHIRDLLEKLKTSSQALRLELNWYSERGQKQQKLTAIILAPT